MPHCRLTGFSYKLDDMQNRFKKLVLTALLLILPLQGIAATLASISCHSSDRESVTASQTQQHDHAAAMEHGGSIAGQNDQDGTSSDYAGHLCCHHPVGGMPVTSVIPAKTGSTAYTSLPPAWPPLFAPEQQLRPPRS